MRRPSERELDGIMPKLNRRRLLTLIFFFALLMGAGPGSYLINGRGPILGLPAVYAWVVFWFLVQAGVVVTASRTIWKGEQDS